MKTLFLFIALLTTTTISVFAQTNQDVECPTCWCTSIEKEVDDFTGDTRTYTPYWHYYKAKVNWKGEITKVTLTMKESSGYNPSIAPAMMTKTIKNYGSTYYLLTLNAASRTLASGDGVVILFSDGSKLTKPNATVKWRSLPGSPYWAYTASFVVSEEELELFVSKEIDKYRLYTHDTVMNGGGWVDPSLMNVRVSSIFAKQVQCLINM